MYRFSGELGKLEMLHEGILHKCIKQLLEKKKHVSIADMAEDLECLCQIMKTVGRRLDRDKARVSTVASKKVRRCLDASVQQEARVSRKA